MKNKLSHIITFVVGVASGLISNSLYSEYVSAEADEIFVREASAEIATRLFEAHQRGVTFTAFRNSIDDVEEAFVGTKSKTELSQFEELRMDNLLAEVSRRTTDIDLKNCYMRSNTLRMICRSILRKKKKKKALFLAKGTSNQ